MTEFKRELLKVVLTGGLVGLGIGVAILCAYKILFVL